MNVPRRLRRRRCPRFANLSNPNANYLTCFHLRFAGSLHPVDALWSHAKYTALANFVPDDIDHLHDAAIEADGDLEWDQRLKESFFQTAELSI